MAEIADFGETAKSEIASLQGPSTYHGAGSGWTYDNPTYTDYADDLFEEFV